MSTCTFFGHHDAPQTLKPQLQELLIRLIEQQHVDTFYIGHQGAFDAMVYTVLQSLASIHPHIVVQIVLAYLPSRPLPYPPAATLLPDGIEAVPRRFAISWRNHWMLRQADFVVTYAVHPGNASRFAELARQTHKTVLALQ